MTVISVCVGDEYRFSKTVSESDVYLFAGISGDFGIAHVNEEHMRHSRFGHRIVHGVLLVAFMSAASSLVNQGLVDSPSIPISVGYDKIRFVAPVFFGDTVTVVYRISEIDTERLRTLADIEVHNQQGKTVAVAKHISQWVSSSLSLDQCPES